MRRSNKKHSKDRKTKQKDESSDYDEEKRFEMQKKKSRKNYSSSNSPIDGESESESESDAFDPVENTSVALNSENKLKKSRRNEKNEQITPKEAKIKSPDDKNDICSRLKPIQKLSKIKRERFFRKANLKSREFSVLEESRKEEERQKQKLFNAINSFKGSNHDLFSVDIDTREMQLCNIRFERSQIEGFGVRTTIPLKKGDKVIEYIGEIIRPIIADKRQIHYEQLGNMGTYVFKVDAEHYLDATQRGGIARWINHSCDPNCESKLMKINGRTAVVLVALKDIKPCEELTYDYKLPYESEKKAIKCLCGSPNCRGWLNRDKNSIDDKTFSEVKFKNISEDALILLVREKILPLELFKADAEIYTSRTTKD